MLFPGIRWEGDEEFKRWLKRRDSSGKILNYSMPIEIWDITYDKFGHTRDILRLTNADMVLKFNNGTRIDILPFVVRG